MIKHGLMVVAAAAVLGATGCGGGDSNKTLSYSDFSNKANEICKSSNEKSAGATLTNDLQANAKVLDEEIPNVESALADFKKLNPPAELKPDFDKFLSTSDQQLASAKKARDAAKAGDKAGFVAALKSAAPLQAQSHEAGSKLGAADCTK